MRGLFRTLDGNCEVGKGTQITESDTGDKGDTGKSPSDLCHLCHLCHLLASKSFAIRSRIAASGIGP